MTNDNYDWQRTPEARAVIYSVEVAWRDWKKAERKLSSCRRPESKALARLTVTLAEAIYRRAAAKRDEFMEIARARAMQRQG